MKKLFLVVLVLGVATLYSCATMNSLTSVPLPQIVQIVPPDSNLPSEIKVFSGKWSGSWWYSPNPSSGKLDAVLIIEKVDEHQAVVVYGWGDNLQWNITKGSDRFTANFSRNKEGKITLSWVSPRTRSKFEFQVKGDELEGVAGANTYITMKRQ